MHYTGAIEPVAMVAIRTDTAETADVIKAVWVCVAHVIDLCALVDVWDNNKYLKKHKRTGSSTTEVKLRSFLEKNENTTVSRGRYTMSS